MSAAESVVRKTLPECGRAVTGKRFPTGMVTLPPENCHVLSAQPEYSAGTKADHILS